ncbi:Gfo/Idh/MocA family protein [Hamadaea tsunoensis]|uniref:Gfo/Idh/MocA family protein n=1 Tax=Hamadaea tsunoensis TaxID=53368 RepID=UPI00041306E5|nr:Gfo/Idh/MocA family oxidoreductase [Hamadaea tsunoensis]
MLVTTDGRSRTAVIPHLLASGADPIRVGIVGAGEQTASHLAPALLHIPGARITAIVDPDTRRRDALAARLGVPAGPATLAGVLDNGLVDCIVAACPPQAHEQIAATAINAGIPVFVEKPPAVTTAALAALAAAADQACITTGVGMNFRWATPIRHLQTVLDAERPDALALAVRHVAAKPTTGLWGLPLWTSFLLAQAIHPIDLMLTLVGTPLRDVHATGHRDGDKIWLTVQLHHTNGSVSTLHCSNLAPRFEHRIDLTTTSATSASLHNLADLTITRPNSEHAEAGVPALRGTASHWRPSPLDTGYQRTGFAAELAAFCTAVRTATRFTPDLADLLPTYRVLDQITPTGVQP